MANLNEAVQLIRQGYKDEARRILEPLLKTDPKNIQIWFWYVETCSTLEQRIKTLEICLKVNPGNPQALQALEILRAKQAGPGQVAAPRPAAPPPPITPPAPVNNDETPEWARRPAVPQPVKSQPVPPPSVIPQPTFPSTAAFEFDEDEPVQPAAPVEASGGHWQQTRGESKPAFDWEALEKQSAPAAATAATLVDAPVAGEQPKKKAPKPQSRQKSLAFYDVWWTALTTQDARVYAALLDDEDAGAGRAFEWIAYVSVVTGLLTPLLVMVNPQFAQLRDLPEFQKLTGNLGMTMFLVVLGLGMAVLAPILGVLSLAINAGLQNLVARLSGGTGTFGRTAYALAAYLAPYTLLTSFLSIIPYVACLNIPLGIYSILLNIRALQAAHNISTVRALMVLLVPGIVLFTICCVLGFVASSAIPGLFSSIKK